MSRITRILIVAISLFGCSLASAQVSAPALKVDLPGVSDRWIEMDGHRLRYINTSNPYNLDDFWIMLGKTEGQGNLLGLSRDRADSLIPGTVVVGSGTLATASAPFHGGGFFSLQGKYFAGGSGDQDLNFRFRAIPTGVTASGPTGWLSLSSDWAYPSGEKELARFSKDGTTLFFTSTLEAQGAGAFIRIHDPNVSWNALRTVNGEIQVQDGGGTTLAGIRAAGFYTGSSRTLKRNIKASSHGLSDVMRLQPRTFDYIVGAKNQIGFISEEVATVLPEITSTGAVDYTKIIPVLVRAIQEQQAQILKLQGVKK